LSYISHKAALRVPAPDFFLKEGIKESFIRPEIHPHGHGDLMSL